VPRRTPPETRGCPRVSTSCGSSSSRPGLLTSLRGQGAPGRAQLYIDGTLVNAEFEYTAPLVFGIAGGAVTCGVDGPSPVVPHDYAPPNAFTGTINAVTIDVSGELIEDDDAAADGTPVGLSR
jgi:hypothetical protein